MKNSKPFMTLIGIFLLLFKANGQTLRMPAEWEPQEKVWLTWFGQERRDSVSCRVIEALQPHIKITLNVESDSMKLIAKKYLANFRIDAARIEYSVDAHVDFFIRDYIFFLKGPDEKLTITCFGYSSFGTYPSIHNKPMSEEEKIYGKWDERTAKKLQMPTINSDYVFEGGGVDANGRGTILSIKEMALQRNPGKTIGEIEAELKRTLGAEKIIWLKDGLVEDRIFPKFGPFYKNYFGGGANRHIDELCRFVDESTVVLPYIPEKDRNKSPVDSINFPMLEENFKILQQARTSTGKPLKIIRVPMPEIELLKFTLTVQESQAERFKEFGLQKGDTIYRVPASSYCNFFISDKVVLISKYWKDGMPESQKQKDEEVRQVFIKLFPGRQIVQIYTLQVNRGGGGIHCMTHELPVAR